MSYQALARKYRPQTFDDMVGQETAVRTLQNAIEQERIHHAYLFSGVRGVGKTTLARILAKALNCAEGPTASPDNRCTMCREITEGIDMDVREIDAATYTGVDNVRELRDVSQFQPARDRYRIFIIDEAHMLSTASWNALLKLIEEPPPHVVFMFATTEIHKVPQTILSRVQKLMLRKITLEDLAGRLAQICRMEGITADDAALEILARRGEGSVRDSLSLLDQIIAFSGRNVSAADVAAVLGLSDSSFFARLVSLIGEGNHGGILEALQEASESGRDFRMLYRDLLGFVRNLLLLAGGASESMLSASPEDLAVVRAVSAKFSYTELLRIANLLLRDDETVNRAEHQRLAVEIALLKAATFPTLRSVEEAVAGSSPQASPRARGGRVPDSMERQAPRAPASPSSAARRPAAPAGEAAAPPRKPGEAVSSDLVDRVRRKRPMIAPYLEEASVERSGNSIRFTFTDRFAEESVAEARQMIEEIASELYGEPVTVTTAVASPAASADKPAANGSPLGDDPVVRAFQKHLGGEIVDARRQEKPR